MDVLHDAVRAAPPASPRARAGQRFLAFRLSDHETAMDKIGLDKLAAAASQAGFDSMLALASSQGDPGAAASDAALAKLVIAATGQGLGAWLQLCMGEADSAGALVRLVAGPAFSPPPLAAAPVADPRRMFARTDGTVRLLRPQQPALIAWWRDRLEQLRALGLRGVTLLDPADAETWLLAAAAPASLQRRLFQTAGAGAMETGDAYVREADNGPLLRAALADVAMAADGWAFEADPRHSISEAARAVNSLLAGREGAGRPAIRTWTGRGAALQFRSRAAGAAALVEVRNQSTGTSPWPPAALPPMPWQDFTPIDGFGLALGGIAPGGVVLVRAAALPPVAAGTHASAAQAAAPSARVTINNVSPSVDNGAFAVKCVIGQAVEVRADIFADGHEQLAACVLTRAADETAWVRHGMAAEPNDSWVASIRLSRLGRHSMVVQGWIDEWGGFTRDFRRKLDAGQDVTLEIHEGRDMITAALARAPRASAAPLQAALVALGTGTHAARADILLRPDVAAAMAASDNPRFLASSFVQPIQVERQAAQFSGWYELFPRSMAAAPGLHGTLRDVIAHLPRVAAMGFDTLYFPPIHPIGERHRKGPNNAPAAQPGDYGSPYAIGSHHGGHTAVHPELGTLDDFRALRLAAESQGLEIALDFAIQCAPDHPWLTDHKGWFAWRPDGSIKFAENPPKKYQDIVNVDFYAPPAVPSLWNALRDVVLFWANEGVRVFRVDNPHTKPLPFWTWMIGEVQALHPDVIFLSEAFTRPKPMYQLAKAGFSQSYTYFTWRNDKAALTDYLVELTQTPVRDFFRPHFFVNTPDINPYFLQTAGRPGFLIRAALAATLSGLWGVYSGFELCESAPLPGREEYLDSEKYELRPRPARVPGDIVAEIAQLNSLRRAEPALQSHLGVQFHHAGNDSILYFSKSAPSHADLILVAISLDPAGAQEAPIEIPLWLFGLQDWESVDTTDLLAGHHFQWTGKMQHIRLTPERPYGIWRIAAPKAA